ncbi:hypothetical protein LJC08_04375 [Methanimicrococcus sp. OttesenSCG-928-J09]|nr:hypothetical protein [Methanimicrococcus sp. OttesenSCG-928-J09]
MSVMEFSVSDVRNIENTELPSPFPTVRSLKIKLGHGIPVSRHTEKENAGISLL